MRITCKQQAGSALLVVLVLGTVLSAMVGTYLTLVRHQNQSVVRSMTWNACIPVAEAGIEEAITHIRNDGLTNLASNGWTLRDGKYRRQRFIGSDYYDVRISSSDPPVIVATAYVALPYGSSLSNYVSRTVRVATRRDGDFMKAMVAKGKIDFNGNNVKTDSFDSADPHYSDNGIYDPHHTKDNGDVATNLGVVNSLNVGNANVYGRVATGPNGSVSIGSNGAVGDSAWQAGHTGIKPGWATDDMNVSFPDVDVPYTSGWTPQADTIDGISYTYVLQTGKYMMSALSLSSSDVLYVVGQAELYVTDDINITGQGTIEIASTGSLTLYMGGASASIGGNGIVNHPGNALNFVYRGLPTNTSLTFSGNGTFTGAIYAPNANFRLGGGGNNNYDFVGASVSNTVQMNGHFNFHYDENLGRSLWSRGYIITGWEEI